MNRQTLTSQLMDSGFFVRVECGATPDHPLAAYLGPAGHEMLLLQGRAAFCGSIGEHAPGDPPSEADWRLAEIVTEAWPTDRQENPAAMPAVLSHLRGESLHRLLLTIEPDLPWFAGHFPGRPILAGVAQVHLAALAARSLFALERLPRRIIRLKFQGLIVPPCVLELRLEQTTADEIRFLIHGEGRNYSQGRLKFADGAP